MYNTRRCKCIDVLVSNIVFKKKEDIYPFITLYHVIIMLQGLYVCFRDLRASSHNKRMGLRFTNLFVFHFTPRELKTSFVPVQYIFVHTTRATSKIIQSLIKFNERYTSMGI